MNKELEALRRMYAILNDSDKWHKDFDLIAEKLTPPTEQEVCDSLNDTWNLEKHVTSLHFVYDKESNEFRMVDKNGCVYRYISFCRSCDNELNFSDLEMKDIIILGAFYGGLKHD